MVKKLHIGFPSVFSITLDAERETTPPLSAALLTVIERHVLAWKAVAIS
jgi:hypothetical protein